MMYDPDYRAHKRFILDWYERLKTNGKVLLGFSTTRFPLKHARQKFQEIWFDAKVFYSWVDCNGIGQEILEVIQL
jgi:hypothetical protein